MKIRCSNLIILFVWIVSSCTSTSTPGNINILTYHSQDLTDQYEAKLVLVDSFTYRLPSPKKIFNGRAYVYDKEMLYLHQANQEIFRFDEKGNFIAKMGGVGEGPGEFVELMTIMIDSAHIYGLGRNPYRINKYDLLGNFVDDDVWDLSGHGEAIEPEFGQLIHLDTGFVSPIYACCNPSSDLVFYGRPFNGIFSKNGKLKYMFGLRDSIYFQDKPLVHLIHIFIAFDKQSENILVSQQGSHFIDRYNTKGVLLSRFGLTTQNMKDVEFTYDRNINFKERSHEVRSYRAKIIFETSMYYDIISTDDFYIRFYRKGISAKNNPVYTWEKPLYYQIYSKEGDLIGEQKAPADWFFPRGTSEGNYCWFSTEDLHWETPPDENRPNKYHHTIYKYQLQVKK